MNSSPALPTPTATADLFLIHAPSVYDFRDRDDVLFAYLSDSDSVNVTSIYEMYPLGLFSIQQRLQHHGFAVDIVNLASLMLMYPDLDVERFLGRLDAPVFGFDLHWMAQCHGSIELARRVRTIHPDALIIFGGLSATYFAEELIEYACVDIVVKGYDTLEPLTMLMQTVREGRRNFDHIPNLLFKTHGSSCRSTGFTHKPASAYNDETVDWSYYRKAGSDATTSRLIMTLPNSGCARDCGWCGGSHFAFQNIMGVKKTLIQKDIKRTIDELRTMGDAAKATSIYALQCYSEPRARLHEYLDCVNEMGYKSVFFEQYYLTPEDTLKKMGTSTQSYIMLSPESHDPVISKMAGRGTFTMKEMEEWIPKALGAGVKGVMVWFFIGMPHQTPESVMETVAYCESLLKKFRGQEVLPLICPMVPFLDPGSRFFEQPARHGYRLFHRSLEDHRRAMVEPLWHRRLNYETKWLSRKQLQDVSYQAIGRLVTAKGEFGLLPSSFCNYVLEMIDETRELLGEMERALGRDDQLPASLRDVIRAYNQKSLAYSSDQIIPIPRPFGDRWFDDFTTPRNIIDACRVTRGVTQVSEST